MVVVALLLILLLIPQPESTGGQAEWMRHLAVLDAMVHCTLPRDLLVVQTMGLLVLVQLQVPKSTALQLPSVEDWHRPLSVLA